MTTTDKQILPVLPLRAAVPMPGAIVPVEVGRVASLRAVEAADGDDDIILLVPQRDPDVSDPEPSDLYEVGLIGELVQVVKHGPTHVTAVIRIDDRAQVHDFVEGLSYLAAHIEPFASVVREDDETKALVRATRNALRPLALRQAEMEGEAYEEIDSDDPDDLVHATLEHIELSRDELLTLLSEADPATRLAHVLPHLEHQRDVIRMGADIKSELVDDIADAAREKVLRERMKSIRAELGEEESEDALDEYMTRIDDSKMPDEPRDAAKREVRRMRNMAPESPQYSVSQTYVDRLLEIPWGEVSEDTLDVSAARAILEAEHAGLAKVKKRILEFIAVRKLAPDKHGPILCLVGPPGVGKTSLGRSIASALGRKYVRASLGGVRDEAEIRGHRRTYIGALPGRIAANLVKAGTMNPVFVLDEVDKLGADNRGDPTSALLEVLDPEQNFEFVDHYLEVPLDLSRVMFIATANTLETIPAPLRDRMEIIQVPSYTRVEKRIIGRHHLLPKQMAEHGLSKEAIVLNDDTLDALIAGYTREAGVRNLERELAALCRSAAVEIASGKAESVTFDVAELEKRLGPSKFDQELAAREPEIGVSTGLAWTPVGGDVLFIEAREMPGKGELKLTGQVGDVMRESVLTALSWVRSQEDRLGIEQVRFEKNDLHVHLPAGGIRKDGPSAGVAMTTALVSLLTGKPVRHDVAMTGEITLRGKVLPVGGIKEKVLAAHRAGIKTLVLPTRNEKDLIDVPNDVRDQLDIHLVDKIDDALAVALSPAPAKPRGAQPPIPPPTGGDRGTHDTESPSV